jgi:hypothetical protein
MKLFRCFPWDREVAPEARGGPLWFPRLLQGYGRHDNPYLYGCLYASEERVSAVVEELARFRGAVVEAADLVTTGLPVSLAEIDLPDELSLVDLDDPAVLAREELRPSLVATRDRGLTQRHSAELFERHPQVVGIRWWSTFESQWPNVTLFDRAAASISVGDVEELSVAGEPVEQAAELLGIHLST